MNRVQFILLTAWMILIVLFFVKGIDFLIDQHDKLLTSKLDIIVFDENLVHWDIEKLKYTEEYRIYLFLSLTNIETLVTFYLTRIIMHVIKRLRKE